MLFNREHQFAGAVVVPFAFSDLGTGTFVPALNLPTHAVITGGLLVVTEVSNSSSTDTLAFGLTGAPTGFANNVNFKALAATALTVTGANVAMTGPSTLGITRTRAGTEGTTGKGVLVVQYVLAGRADFPHG